MNKMRVKMVSFIAAAVMFSFSNNAIVYAENVFYDGDIFWRPEAVAEINSGNIPKIGTREAEIVKALGEMCIRLTYISPQTKTFHDSQFRFDRILGFANFRKSVKRDASKTVFEGEDYRFLAVFLLEGVVTGYTLKHSIRDRAAEGGGRSLAWKAGRLDNGVFGIRTFWPGAREDNEAYMAQFPNPEEQPWLKLK